MSGDPKSRFSAESTVVWISLYINLASLHFNTKICTTVDFEINHILGILGVHRSQLRRWLSWVPLTIALNLVETWRALGVYDPPPPYQCPSLTLHVWYSVLFCQCPSPHCGSPLWMVPWCGVKGPSVSTNAAVVIIDGKVQPSSCQCASQELILTAFLQASTCTTRGERATTFNPWVKQEDYELLSMLEYLCGVNIFSKNTMREDSGALLTS